MSLGGVGVAGGAGEALGATGELPLAWLLVVVAAVIIVGRWLVLGEIGGVELFGEEDEGVGLKLNELEKDFEDLEN